MYNKFTYTGYIFKKNTTRENILKRKLVRKYSKHHISFSNLISDFQQFSLTRGPHHVFQKIFVVKESLKKVTHIQCTIALCNVN